MLEFFPDAFLKNRWLNKGYRSLGPIWQAWLRRSIKPAGTRLERLGSDYGGWYFPVDEVRADWVIYSGGVGQDTTFDEAVMDRFGCTVYMFDPTPHAIEHVVMRLTRSAWMGTRAVFKPVGLWSKNVTLRFFAPRTRGWVGSFSVRNLQGMEDGFDAPCRSLASLMAELGHHRIDFLKIDIEGAEYEVIRSVLDANICVGWMAVEFDQPVPLWTTGRLIADLRAHDYSLVHSDRWNFLFRRG